MTALVLFNGLWQGALLAVFGYGVTLLVPKRDAATRYAIWFTTLVAIATIPPITTVLPSPFAAHHFISNSGVGSNVSMHLLALTEVATTQHAALVGLVPWLLALWILGVLLKFGRLVGGAARMRCIARNAQPLDAQAARADVFLSDDVDVPLVAGIVAPRILIPRGMSQTLDAADLERIVAHERAHIRRNDPPFNLFARIIEAVLFFNPAVAIVARNVAAEREAACDDLVVAQTGRNRDYAACLAALARARPHRIEIMVPGALGFRTSLLSRIARLQSAQPRITHLNRTAVGGIIMLFIIATLALQTLNPTPALSAPAAHGKQGAPFSIAAICAQPNRDASVMLPQPPELPHGLNGSGSGESTVILAASGRVEAVTIRRSSGNSAVDAAIASAARRSTYRPRIVNCLPVQGTYVFRVDFKP